MHKKLEADLISLAHSILQMKNKDDVFALEKKAKEIADKLTMLAFVETYVNTTPNLKESKEKLIVSIEEAYENKEFADSFQEEKLEELDFEDEFLQIDNEKLEAELGDGFLAKEIVSKPLDGIEEVEESLGVVNEEVLEQPFDELEEILKGTTQDTFKNKNDVKDVGERKKLTLEEELEDTIPVDIMASLFENAPSKSLNDKLTDNIQIGLNDRITFVKNLFNGSQEDFNRVVSQLNTLKTEKEANKFINKMVKPDYNWEDQEDLEARFMEIVQRKFV